jgi:hypothetical protein
MKSLSEYRLLKARGKSYLASDFPGGIPGLQLLSSEDGEYCECSVSQTDNGVAESGAMRSEIAGFEMPRFGYWRMDVEFCVPKFWSQNCAAFWFTATPDPLDKGIHNSPLNFNIQNDVIGCGKKYDPLATSIGDAPSVTLGTAKLVEGRWHKLSMDVNFSWLSDGFVHATLDGQYRLAHDSGPNCYNDQTPLFSGFGVYWWGITGDPMRMLVREFNVR